MTTNVNVPKDADLAGLLRGSGGQYERHINGLSNAAHPDSGASQSVTFLDGEAAAVARDLQALHARSREHPAAAHLTRLLAAFGVKPLPAPPAPVLPPAAPVAATVPVPAPGTGA